MLHDYDRANEWSSKVIAAARASGPNSTLRNFKVHNLNRNHTLNLSCFRNIKAED